MSCAKNRKRIAVVGAGALGLFYGSRLELSGNDVHYLVRGDYDVLRSEGLRVLSETHAVHIPHPYVAKTSEQIGICDLVLVTLKATANTALKKILPPLLGGQTVVLTLRNGLGNEESLQTLTDPRSVMGGVCFVCLNRTGPGCVHHIRHGAVEIGEWSDQAPARRLQEVAGMFTAGGIDCAVSRSLAATRWRKLVWNIPFNGLSIVAGGVGVDVLLRPPWRDRVKALMRETIAVAAAHGVEIEPGMVDDQIAKTEIMGDYRPSSLIDFEKKRPLELEAIWGEPLRRARAAVVSTPELAELYDRLGSLIASEVQGAGKSA